MSDAYNIGKRISELWSRLAMTAGADLNKRFNDVYVYVRTDDKLVKVVEAVEQDGKIVLVTESKE